MQMKIHLLSASCAANDFSHAPRSLGWLVKIFCYTFPLRRHYRSIAAAAATTKEAEQSSNAKVKSDTTKTTIQATSSTTLTNDVSTAVNIKPEPLAVDESITSKPIVTESQPIIEAADDANNADQPPPKPPKAVTLQPPAIPEGRLGVFTPSQSVEAMKNDLNATVIPKFSHMNGTAQAITGILKGGKLRKTDSLNQVRKRALLSSALRCKNFISTFLFLSLFLASVRTMRRATRHRMRKRALDARCALMRRCRAAKVKAKMILTLLMKRVTRSLIINSRITSHTCH